MTQTEAATNGGGKTSKSAELETQLDHAQRIGAINGYEKRSTGKELVWRLELPSDGAVLELKTKETGLFLLGVDVGRQLGGTRRQPSPVREAIARDQRVVVPLTDPDDSPTVRRQRNSLFAQAYSLGLKGKFTVKRDGNNLVGTVTS